MDDDGRAAWEAWRVERVERLRAERGWLAVTGLHWLEPGANRVPGLPGVFALRDGQTWLEARREDGWTVDGAPVERRALATDGDARPDLLALGAGRFAQVIARGGRLALRTWDADAPARGEFRGVETFPWDPAWRVVADWEPFEPPRVVVVQDVVGLEAERPVPGRARFRVDGRPLSLEPTADGERLAFVFRDATAGVETYGAGRFLSADGPRDGRVVLDFNRAFNPPCAFTPFATCPLPRPENVLPVRVTAGERAPRWPPRGGS